MKADFPNPGRLPAGPLRCRNRRRPHRSQLHGVARAGLLVAAALDAAGPVAGFAVPVGRRAARRRSGVAARGAYGRPAAPALGASGGSDFDFAQRIESAKCGVLGLVAGGIALTPFAALDDIFFYRGLDALDVNGLAQWEFDTDMGSIQGALFAIVYRYCVREDFNPMLNQGVIGAFVLVRTLPRIIVPKICSAIPLECGDPIGYFDWGMIGQGIIGFVESAALFGATAYAMDYCFEKGYISKFRS